METFRTARPEELSAIARLVAHSFVSRSASEHEEKLRNGVWGDFDALWVAESGGELVGACHLHPLQEWVGGVSLPTMGLGTVSIAPTYRRRGLAGRMISAGLHETLRRGQIASALYPFRVGFYEKLGYGRAGEVEQYRFAPEMLPDAPERIGVSLVDGASLPKLQSFYARWAPTQNGQLHRNDRSWAALLDHDGRAAFLYRGPTGEAEGYVVVRYRGDLPPADRFLDVLEQGWTTAGARRGIHAWLGSLGDQWRLISYRAHPDEGFGELLQEPRLAGTEEPGWNLWYPSATLLRGTMFRILSIERAFAVRTFGESSLSVGLDVTDDQIPSNGGRWKLVLAAGVASLERAGEAESYLKLSISTLSRIYIGALAPTRAVELGLATLTGATSLPALDAALRLPRPWTFDAF